MLNAKYDNMDYNDSDLCLKTQKNHSFACSKCMLIGVIDGQQDLSPSAREISIARVQPE